MTRSQRQALAHDTVAILKARQYSLPSGEVVSITDSLESCLEATEFLLPNRLSRMKYDVWSTPPTHSQTAIEVVNETTLSGAARVVQDANGERVTVLIFASAKNAGGGFLNGSEAQEESLARSSALYASLQRAPEYYARHRASSSALYSDAMILSPNCPVFRNDDGELLAKPYCVTFITSAAPNAGAITQNQPQDVMIIPDTFRQRAEFVLALAASVGTHTLVLGAWGCGVFRNDPAMVAETFAELLAENGSWNHRFARVVFSVLDRSPTQPNFTRFREAIPAVVQ